jgi:hypothetical protein
VLHHESTDAAKQALAAVSGINNLRWQVVVLFVQVPSKHVEE